MNHHQNAPTSFIIISGFLGCGKTTLVNRLLGEGFVDERTAIVVNDFGAIDVDAALIDHREDGMLVLANGCVCCSLASDLVRGLKEMLDAGVASGAPYDRVIMETSGVTAVESLLRALEWPGLKGLLALERIIVVVDAVRHEKYRRVVRVADEQVAHADVIVLNLCDAATPEQRAGAEAAIRAVNAQAEIIPTTQAQVTREQLGIHERRAGAGRRGRAGCCECGHEHGAHGDGHGDGHESGHEHEHEHAEYDRDRDRDRDRDTDYEHEHEHDGGHEHVVTDDWYTCRVFFDRPVTREALEGAVGSLAAGVQRMKGFVREAGGGVLHLERVAERLRIEEWLSEKQPEALNVLVAIGSEPITAALEAAFAPLPGTRITSDHSLHSHKNHDHKSHK